MAKGLNVVLFSSSFLPNIGGREFVLHHLARSLAGLGHHPRVVVAGGWWRHRTLRFEYGVHRIPVLLRGLPGRLEPGRRLQERYLSWQLRRNVEQHGCDLIHAHTTYPQGYVAAGVAQRFGIPLVLTPHGADIHTIPDLGHGLRLRPLLAAKIQRAVREASAVTAISQSVEQSLLDAGAEPPRLHRINNGVDLERFAQPLKVDVRGWLGVSPHAILVLTVGNYHPRKGQHLIVRAVREVCAAVPDCHLVIVGRGTEALEPLIGQLGMESRVSLTGLMAGPRPGVAEPDMLAALYQSAAAYVSAGVEEGAEGLSLAVLEAMAAGLPVVASDISGNRDVVKAGENGFLVPSGEERPLADALRQVLQDESLRLRLREGAGATAKHFSWRAVAQCYVALYENLLRKHPDDSG